MTEHTPTPWEAQPFDDAEFGIGIIGLRTNDGVPYSNPTNGLVGWATMLPTDIDAHDTSLAEANAAFIVRAVNNHETLLDALRFALEVMESYAFSSGNDPRTATPESAIGRARAAIAAVVGNSQVTGGE